MNTKSTHSVKKTAEVMSTFVNILIIIKISHNALHMIHIGIFDVIPGKNTVILIGYISLNY